MSLVIKVSISLAKAREIKTSISRDINSIWNEISFNFLYLHDSNKIVMNIFYTPDTHEKKFKLFYLRLAAYFNALKI